MRTFVVHTAIDGSTSLHIVQNRWVLLTVSRWHYSAQDCSTRSQQLVSTALAHLTAWIGTTRWAPAAYVAFLAGQQRWCASLMSRTPLDHEVLRSICASNSEWYSRGVTSATQKNAETVFPKTRVATRMVRHFTTHSCPPPNVNSSATPKPSWHPAPVPPPLPFSLPPSAFSPPAPSSDPCSWSEGCCLFLSFFSRSVFCVFISFSQEKHQHLLAPSDGSEEVGPTVSNISKTFLNPDIVRFYGFLFHRVVMRLFLGARFLFFFFIFC